MLNVKRVLNYITTNLKIKYDVWDVFIIILLYETKNLISLNVVIYISNNLYDI